MSDTTTPVLEKDSGEERPAESRGAGADASGRRGGRFWSARRVTAGIVALLLLAASGLLLYDLASVRAGRPAMAWRRSLADGMATARLDDVLVLAASAAAAALGLWLLVLALTPGVRKLLPMRRADPRVRAGLDRPAAALILRDRAMQVSGVHSVRVDVTRHRAKARAHAHFRDLDTVRTDLREALDGGIRALGLTRRLRTSVRVRRPKKG